MGLFKRIIFGDFHGHFDSLNAIYQMEKPYEVIHLGDYFDNFSNDVNKIKGDFESLLELRDKHLSDTKNGDFILLLGNHDYHYLQYGLEKYSGYNTGYDLWAYQKLKELWDNKQLKIVWYDFNTHTLYSHAGLTNTWLKEHRMEGIDLTYLNDPEMINLFSLRFTYIGGDWYGDSVYSSPIWVRPNSLLSDMYVDEEGVKWTQIVGHTHNNSPICYFEENNKVGYSRVEDYHYINSSYTKPILWVMDCMPKYYIVEMINEYGEVKSRRIEKFDDYKKYE